MVRSGRETNNFSRRDFLKTIGWAPSLFLAAPFQGFLRPQYAEIPGHRSSALEDFHLTPHYPSPSPLDDVLRLVTPGLDEYMTEKYASEIMDLLTSWSKRLRSSRPDLSFVATFLAPLLEATPLHPSQDVSVRSGTGIEILRRHFSTSPGSGRDRF